MQQSSKFGLLVAAMLFRTLEVAYDLTLTISAQDNIAEDILSENIYG